MTNESSVLGSWAGSTTMCLGSLRATKAFLLGSQWPPSLSLALEPARCSVSLLAWSWKTSHHLTFSIGDPSGHLLPCNQGLPTKDISIDLLPLRVLWDLRAVEESRETEAGRA